MWHRTGTDGKQQKKLNSTDIVMVVLSLMSHLVPEASGNTDTQRHREELFREGFHTSSMFLHFSMEPACLLDSCFLS